jgi:hypothetical protein
VDSSCCPGAVFLISRALGKFSRATHRVGTSLGLKTAFCNWRTLHAILYSRPETSWGCAEPVSRGTLYINVFPAVIGCNVLLWGYFLFVVVNFCKANATLKQLTKLFIFAIKIIVLKAY